MEKTKIPGWLIGLAIATTLLVAGLGVWAKINGIRNEAIYKETQLSAEYRVNQNHLSSFISEFHETVGIADRKTDQLDRVLMDAVKGRYGEDGFTTNGALFTALREAYPDLQGLNIYDQILSTIRAGRTDFKNRQDKLLDELRDYDAWRAQGILRSIALGNFFPSRHLEARFGSQIFYGQEAEEKMKDIVLVQEATDAYTTGRMAPLQAPPLPPRK